MKTLLLSVAALCASVMLGACGEKPQTAGTRKADVGPVQGAQSSHTAAGWKVGDATSWEAHLKARTLNGQNEYARTGAH
jgi:major membrane immunogen (membrane-anchored lipoprotein)